ncbi:MAG: SGNH/GDSL hydrolase family protein [Deltaproteobacteria bacterium]|nr:SGNH/GDSL hydrolase family protein [Deltaproteobacteria bacterium]
MRLQRYLTLIGMLAIGALLHRSIVGTPFNPFLNRIMMATDPVKLPVRLDLPPMEHRPEEVVHRETIRDEELTLSADQITTFSFAVPAPGITKDRFLGVTFEVISPSAHERLAVLTNSAEITYSRPIFASNEWQDITMYFPHDSAEPNFSLQFQPAENTRVRNLRYIVAEYKHKFKDDPSYMRNYFLKGSRKRIAIVGNSTVYGAGAERGASFPLLLQLKLETHFPGKYEVMNLGVPGVSFIGHIISITNYGMVGLATWPNPEAYRRTLHRAPALRDMQPVLVILAAHWNDCRRFHPFLGYGEREPSLLDYLPSTYPANRLYADIALKSLFRFFDNPSHQAYTKMTSDYMEMLSQPFDQAQAIRLAQQHYDFLTESYVERFKRYMPDAQLILMTLPDVGGEITKEQESLVQRSAYIKVAAKHALPLIDLSSEFLNAFPAASRALRYAESLMFSDEIHATYLGNQWIADMSFAELRERLHGME